MKLVDIVSGWVNRYLAHEEALHLVLLLVLGLVVMITLGGVLAPVLTGLVIAFLLQGVVARLTRWNVPHTLAVHVAFVLFLGVLAALLLVIFPLIGRQLYAFVDAIPGMLERLQELMLGLPERYPTLVSETQIETWMQGAAEEFAGAGQRLIAFFVSQIGSLVSVIIYLVLVPILVFFFLKDRDLLLAWLDGMLPSERPLMDRVGREMNEQIANYVRGKVIEILIVGSVTYLVFTLLGVNYAALLGLLVGLSVLVPFIGAAVVTIPVALVGFVQWGVTLDFAWLLIAYAVIQALDGNVLVPLLFSEAVNLHPIAIIVAILAFGGIWGLWGVFFAIPLASLIKAVMSAWPEQLPAET